MALRGLQSLSKTLGRFTSSSSTACDGSLLTLRQLRNAAPLFASSVMPAAASQWARALHNSTQLRSDDASKASKEEHMRALDRELEEAKREMSEFFGVSSLESATGSEIGVAASQGDDNGFSYRPHEAQPTTPEHPQPVSSGRLTHVDKEGRASMVDVARKVNTSRVAIASAKVLLGSEVYQLVASNSIRKGDVLTVAELAGIMGAKHTSTLIPLCHNLPLSYVDVKLKLLEEQDAVGITAEVRTVGTTGVEMEALTAASVAALTIYDMCKAVSRRLEIQDVRLEKKTGGKTGTFVRDGEP